MSKGLISLMKKPDEENINQLRFAFVISEFLVKVVSFIDAYVDGLKKSK